MDSDPELVSLTLTEEYGVMLDLSNWENQRRQPSSNVLTEHTG